MKEFKVSGVATVSVYATIDAESEEEALEIASGLSGYEWEVDEVDGDVEDVEVLEELEPDE